MLLSPHPVYRVLVLCHHKGQIHKLRKPIKKTAGLHLGGGQRGESLSPSRFAEFPPPLGIYKLVCVVPQKVFNTQFLPSLNKIFLSEGLDSYPLSRVVRESGNVAS